MSKSIMVAYNRGATLVEVNLSYSTQMNGNIQTIVCSVGDTHIPFWLQLRKFEMVSMKDKNVYMPLFNEINNEKNMDTVLFIDKVYAEIMLAEKLKVSPTADLA